MPTDPRFRPGGRNYPLIWSFLLACGGTVKTTSVTSLGTVAAERGYKTTIIDLDAQCNASEVAGYPAIATDGRPARLPETDEERQEELDENGFLYAVPPRPTVFDVMLGKATFEEAVVPARYRVGPGWGDDAFEIIENLFLLPGSSLMKNADTLLASEPEHFFWFRDVLEEYEGDDDLFMLDCPASYGRMVLSTAMMMDEDDEVIAAVLAAAKPQKAVPKLQMELAEIRETYRKKRNIPGRPTMRNILLCGTPTASYNELDARLAVEEMERDYGQMLLPYVRYSAQAKHVFRDNCPVSILAPKSVTAEDYRKVATHMGVTNRAAA